MASDPPDSGNAERNGAVTQVSEISVEELDQVPPQLRDKITTILAAEKLEVFSSPLLPPEILKRYDDLFPDLELVKKLVSWTEAEAEHRRALERDGFEEVKTLRSKGQTIGLVVALAGLGCATVVGSFAAVYGSWSAASASAAFAIAAVGGPFVARILAGRWGNKAEDSES